MTASQSYYERLLSDMSTAEATEDMQLAGGYTLRPNVTDKNITFNVIGLDGRSVMSIEVRAPLSVRRSSWRDPAEWDPERDEPEYSYVDTGYYRHRMLNPAAAKAVAEAMQIAADFCHALNEQAAEALAWQEYERRDVREREIRELAEEELKRAEIKESVQWYVGQKFKLRRKGYKATVFGVIDRISDTTLYTTSERGVSMTTQIDDLIELHIMYDGERRYTKVFPA
jgi:hypothetical protein